MDVDVAIVGDFRFPGGTSTSIASEVEAIARAGYRVALIALAAPRLSARRPMHPAILRLAASGQAVFVPQHQPVRAALACLHHPTVFAHYPAVPPRLSAGRTLMIAHHPPVDGLGQPQYDIAQVSRVAGELFGEPLWAPVGPLVRAAFARAAPTLPLAAADWVNVIDADAFALPRAGFSGAIPVVGRHSRPAAVKWPATREDLLGAYPDDPGIRVRLMGWDGSLDPVLGPRPPNWEVLPFDAMPARDFLAGIDYFSYFHSEAWIEAFGRSILEAMAAGVPCILPAHFAPLFGEAALYRTPREVAETVHALQADPAARLRLAEGASALVRERFGPASAVARVAALIGPPATPAAPARAPVRPAGGGVLCMTSNGIGMGHLTRMLAIARRLPASAPPVIATMSKAFGAARDFGIAVEYLPYWRSAGMDETLWEAGLRDEIAELVRFHRPAVFAFDGNLPYLPMLDALDAFPALWKVWVRRGLWRPGAGEKVAARDSAFDAVLEPGELAGALDRGVTRDRPGQVVTVPPIRLLDADEMLPRDAARAAIGLDPDLPAVLLQPGSGNNFATADMFDHVCRHLRRDPEGRRIQIVFGEWRIAETTIALPPGVIRLDTFPIARCLNAFDFAVAMAGYNTFHENVFAGLPTLFLSNDNPMHDEQWLRADYGALRRLCLAARSDDPYGIARELDDLRRPGLRQAIRRACLRLSPTNGAVAAADWLAQLALTRKPHVAGPRAAAGA